MPLSRRRRRPGGRGSFAVWMLVTVGLLVPTQWLAYRSATRAAADTVFPISAWSDPGYPPAPARTVQPIRRTIVDAIASASPSAEPTPSPSSQPSPGPSGRTSPTPTPSTSPTGTPSPSPSPTPRPKPPPRIEIRAESIESPDGSSDLYYRWRIRIENPSDGEWLDDVSTLTQVPTGMQRMECGRGVTVDAGDVRAPNAAAPGTTCHPVAPPASEDGHDLSWDETTLGPGHVRVYTFEARVTAGSGSTIRNHAHLKWRGAAMLSTKTCQFVVDRANPRACLAASG